MINKQRKIQVSREYNWSRFLSLIPGETITLLRFIFLFSFLTWTTSLETARETWSWLKSSLWVIEYYDYKTTCNWIYSRLPKVCKSFICVHIFFIPCTWLTIMIVIISVFTQYYGRDHTLSLFVPMNFPINFNIVTSGRSIINIERLQAIIFKMYSISFSEDLFGLSKRCRPWWNAI